MKMVSIDEEDLKRQISKKLWSIAIDLQESMKDKLTPEHGKFTGALQGSVKVNVTANNEIIISMDEHGKYLEYGTAPHFPPVDALKDWVRVKWGASGKEINSKAFLLARHISVYGTRPFPFIRPTLSQDLPLILKKNLQSLQ